MPAHEARRGLGDIHDGLAWEMDRGARPAGALALLEDTVMLRRRIMEELRRFHPHADSFELEAGADRILAIVAEGHGGRWVTPGDLAAILGKREAIAPPEEPD